jgi:hypothetical protein
VRYAERVNRFAFIAALSCVAPAFAETAYFTQIEDLPIPPGLEETSDRVEMSDAEVRMLGASARGPGNAEQARTYYQRTLPALGWALSLGSGGENETVYIRGREQLSLSFFQRAEELEVQVLLFIRSPPRD